VACFEQCYNAQAAVTADSLLVVATDVVQAANDKQQIEPMLGQLATLPTDLGRPQTLLGDNGYFSAANVAACAAAEIAPLLAPGLTPHHPSLDERFAAAPPAPEHPTPLEAMLHCLATPEGKKLYAQRKPIPTRNPLSHPPDDRRIQLRRPVSASPRPVGRRSGKAEWFKRYRDNERPQRFDRIVQSWDTANKVTELSDYSVCTTWGVKDKDLFLLGLFRRRLEYPALKRAVREQQSLFGASVVLIEDKASGTQLIQDLIAEGCHGVTRYQPSGDKTMRLHAQTAVIENGFVHIPATAPWLAEYLHELTVFPNGKHDDQADSTAQFLDWFKRPFPGQGLYELMRIRAERARNRENPERRFHHRDGQLGLDRYRVRLRAPPGLGAVQTSSGQHIIVGLDGTIEMSAADAQFYNRDGWTKLAEWTTDEEAAAERSKPQSVQTMPQPGSMEWFEAQKKKG
jgi:predicted phage terminase large subunit-like protein